MHEVEIKVSYPSHHKDRLLQYLDQNGYRYVSREGQLDDYYNHPNRDFAETDEALRIRTVEHSEKSGKVTFLTYKGKNQSLCGQIREELECEVQSGETVRRILDCLGFKAAAQVCKERIVYEREDVTFCLDEVEGLGTYLEIEILCKKNVIDETRKRLQKILEEISFIDFTMEPRTYLDLLTQK